MEDETNSIDNQEGGATDNLSAQDATTELTQDSSKGPYTPFSMGKEKFKVNGVDEEWDWETTKKYASLGKSGYQALERAAQTEKKVQDTYKQLMHLAQTNPEGLLQVLNPNHKPQANQGPASTMTDEDPRDRRFQELEQRYETMAQQLERSQIEEEKKLIQQELGEATDKYPILKNDEIAIDYVKAQYRKALQAGMDVTLEDVAFHVAQKLEQSRMNKVQNTKQRLDENKRKAPVTSAPGGSGSGEKKMSMDDVKRLAGRIA